MKLENILKKKFIKLYTKKCKIVRSTFTWSPCIVYDKACLGSQSYISLAKEFMNKESKVING